MTQLVIDWRSVATAGVIGTLLLAPIANASPTSLAQATPAPAAAPAQPAPASGTAQDQRHQSLSIDARIGDLRKRLQITSAQEGQFNALADTMRGNLQAMETLLQQRQQDADRSAVGALRWYQRLTEAHAAALQKFVPAFEALYTTLSDSQRKTADAIFGRFAQRRSHRRAR